MKNQALQASRRLVLFGLVASCLTIFETPQSLSSRVKPTAQKSQIETVERNVGRAPASATKACALYYEREEHPSWSRLQKTYKGHPEIILVPLAKPSDIVRCVLDHNPEEILIFARPLEIDSEHAQLSFFFSLNEDEALRNYRKNVASLKYQHQRIVQQKDFSYCDTGLRKAAFCSKDQREELKIRGKISRISRLKTIDPQFKMAYGYGKSVVSPEPFESLYSLVKTSNLRLKKIRLLTTQPQKIMNAYPGLQRMVLEQGIKLSKIPGLP